MAIRFHRQQIAYQPAKKTALKNWIVAVAASEQQRCGDINYIFCNDEDLLKINRQYLNHDTLTDIITFDYTQNKVISGDIFISIERVKENARSFNTGFEEELHRVMIHGILHLCGYKDKNPAQKKQMRDKENTALALSSCPVFS